MVMKWRVLVGIFAFTFVLLSLYLLTAMNHAAQPYLDSDKAKTLVVTYQPNGEIIVQDGTGERISPVGIGKNDPIEFIVERNKEKKVDVTRARSTLFFTYSTNPNCACKSYGTDLYCVPKEGCP